MTAGLIVVIGSITTASRLEKKLSNNGINARVVHTPAELGNGGCSYSVRTAGENLPVVIEAANRYRIKPKAYYLTEISAGKEVYHAIS